jgi:hypothetical protein
MPPSGKGIALGNDVQGFPEAGEIHHNGREKRRARS